MAIEFKAGRVELLQGFGRQRLLIDLESELAAEDMDKLAAANRPWRCSLSEWRNKRSTNANSYMWALLTELAAVLHTTKDDLYLDMLEKYGVSTVYTAESPQAAKMMSRMYKLCRVLGPVRVDGKAAVQIMCFVGSSNYDTAEMATLLDGIIGECVELGISVKPAEDITRMKEEWGR